MNEDNIMAMFLKIITEYDYLEYEEDELKADFIEILEMAVVEVQLQGLMLEVDFDADFGFSQELSRNMAYILAHACALVWVTPKVNSAELLATALTSTDFTMFSPANRLQSCLKLMCKISSYCLINLPFVNSSFSIFCCTSVAISARRLLPF